MAIFDIVQILPSTIKNKLKIFQYIELHLTLKDVN